jgi:hypothetical protein
MIGALQAMAASESRTPHKPTEKKRKSRSLTWVDEHGNQIVSDYSLRTGPRGGKFIVKSGQKRYKKRKFYRNEKGEKVFYE